MGWGILFFGYFLVFVLGLNPVFQMFLAIPGWLLMLVGLGNLKRYCRSFNHARWCVYPALAVAAWQMLGGIQTQFQLSLPFLIERVTAVVDWAELLLILLFHTLLALSIKELALRVSVTNNVIRAMRNLVLVWLYGILTLVGGVVSSESLVRTMYPIALLLQLIWAIAFCVLLYSCYMRICPADDTQNVRKTSRFGWVNRLRDTMEAKEQKAIEADRAYHQKQARERQEKRLARLSRKQLAKQQRKDRRKK